MKKFIFGVMLLVSMLGIVGCSNPSNSDDPTIGNVYRVKNGTTFDITVSYENKSNGWTDVKIPVDKIYEIPASNVKIVTETVTVLGISGDVSVGHFKIKSNGVEEASESIPEERLKEGVQIGYVDCYTYSLIDN